MKVIQRKVESIMNRKQPFELWENRGIADTFLSMQPCSVVAINCALRDKNYLKDNCFDELVDDVKCYNNGYLKLADMNRALKWLMRVQEYRYFKKTERIKLEQLAFLVNPSGKAIICVKGHFIYANKDTYYSYFDNDNDEIVAIWYLG